MSRINNVDLIREIINEIKNIRYFILIFSIYIKNEKSINCFNIFSRIRK